MRTLTMWIATTLLACASSLALAAPVQMGKKTIEITAPVGYARVAPEMKELLELLDTFTPPTNLSLGLYLSEQDMVAASGGELPEMTRRFVVQIPKMLVDQPVSAAEFERLKASARQDLEKRLVELGPKLDGLMAKASDSLSEKVGTEVEVGVDGMVPLPVHHETPDSLSMSMMLRYVVGIPGGESSTLITSGTLNFVRAKDTVFLLLVYGGEDDLAWTREQSAAWVAAITTANATP